MLASLLVALLRAALVSTLILGAAGFVSAGCSAHAPQPKPAATAVEVPRASEPLDLPALADRIALGAPVPRPVWSTLPAHVRRAIEQRLAHAVTPEQKLAEIERRRGAFDFDDEAATISFAETFFLLEVLAFGPASDARTEARAMLAGFYVQAERSGDFVRWTERLARRLDPAQRDHDFSAFLRAFAEGGTGMHRAFAAAAVRDGKPAPSVARALLAHAWYLRGKDDHAGSLSTLEAAFRVDPAQPADLWLVLGSSYALVLDADRAAIALARSESAPAGTMAPDELAKRRSELRRRIALVREVNAAGTPSTPAARLALAEALRGIGAHARAEALLREVARELPGDARPRIALARLRLQRSDATSIPSLAREVLAALEPARKLENRTSELYELMIGLSGLTALEDVLSAIKDPAELSKRAKEVVSRFRALNDEHAALAPERAAVLSVALDLATAGTELGPRFVEALPELLRASHPGARAVLTRYPEDPAARMVGVSAAAFAADPAEAFAFVTAKPAVPDPPALVVTRAEIALDLALSRGDAAMVARARAVADEAQPGDRVRDARVSAVRGDAEVFLARSRAGSLATAEAHYRDAVRGLPSGERARILANLAWVLAQTGRVELAADALREAIGTSSKDTNTATAMAVMATLALSVRQPEDALALTDKAVAIDADHAIALMARAVAKKQLGRPDDARADAARALGRIERSAKTTPGRLWGQSGVFGDATLDFNLGIASESPRYDLRLSAFHRAWWLFLSFDMAELRALGAPPAPPPVAPSAKAPRR